MKYLLLPTRSISFNARFAGSFSLSCFLAGRSQSSATVSRMLAALHFVTYVAIAEAPDAIDTINAIKPDIYAKGSDYQNPDGDVTGKIALERKAVEAYGGTVRFTDEITFSSTELINRHFNQFEAHVRAHLTELRDDGGLSAILGSIQAIQDYRVVLVGDLW